MKEGCKVSGPYSETKWVNGAITGVVDPANKKANLSSVFTCLYFI